ncbi:MAG: DUF2974 domain-containing protein [Lachnospiraceae bacterium]|nr:DUF2974 domain-containing protein [Lachnospiraceae bacterium]
MALSTEDLVLINNLMYLGPSGPDSPFSRPDGYNTVGEWLNNIDLSKIDNNADYGAFTTGKEWRDVIEAAKNNPTIMKLNVMETHVDNASGGGNGYSAVFVSPDTGDAVVAFAGTAGDKEWKDNFEGGNVTDTPQQKNALDWYQKVYNEYNLGEYEVTVTGHSKGGNKSKYITLMDETVDNCVSFDGQGFSDKFMEKYSDEIAMRQSKIQNHNVDYDYVNILLNDVGEKTYYKGHNYSDNGGQFLENHCMNTFMKFDGEGGFSLEVNPNGQAQEMKDIDAFFNGFLRSLSDDQRNETLELVNMLINDGFSLKEGQSAQEIADIFINTMTDPKYSDDLARLLAYTIRYEQQNPSAAEGIKNVLNKFGLGDFNQYVDLVDSVLNFETDVLFMHITFDDIVDFLNGAGNVLLDIGFVLDKVSDYIFEKTGIRLSHDQIKKIWGLASMINEDMDHVVINDGADIEVSSDGASDEYSSDSRCCSFYCNIEELAKISSELNDLKKHLDSMTAEIIRKSANLNINLFNSMVLRNKIIKVGTGLKAVSDKVSGMSTAINMTVALVKNTEKRTME